jgi:hypothetical protein
LVYLPVNLAIAVMFAFALTTLLVKFVLGIVMVMSYRCLVIACPAGALI